MVREIRLYVEGGGDHSDGKRRLSGGLNEFLRDVHEAYRRHRRVLRVVLCGGRDNTFKQFVAAHRFHGDAHCLLLVDSDEALRCSSRWDHLRQVHGSERPDWATEDQCHFMAQVMESWIIADLAALQAFYGKDLLTKGLPGHKNLEEVDKEQVYRRLRDATAKTKRGEYHKIQHAAELLKLLRPAEVQDRAPHCARLFETLRRLNVVA